jgi:acetyltransferase-like isoleucine patch superfamily enzyme
MATSRTKSILKTLKMRLWTGPRFRIRYLGKGAYIGPRPRIRKGCLSLGESSYIGPECWIAVDDLEIGRWAMIAGRVSFVGGDHLTQMIGSPMIQAGRDTCLPIIVGDDTWIGHQSIILHGVTIGEGAIVGAGSVVTKDVPPYSIAVGVPARVIGKRFTDEETFQHRAALASLRTEGVPGEVLPKN